jgi:predicted nuclease with TOPRIM domain
LKGKVDQLNDKSEKIDKDIDRRIEELKDLLAKNNATKGLNKEIDDFLQRMKDDLGNLKELLRKLPEQIQKLLETLNEMKKGSTPDESADYWEERKDIEKWIDVLEKQDAALKNIQKIYDEKEKKFKHL